MRQTDTKLLPYGVRTSHMLNVQMTLRLDFYYMDAAGVLKTNYHFIYFSI